MNVAAMRILVVDDSLSMRQMIALTLRSAGYEVIEAADGQEALVRAQQQSFHLVLADFNMPRMDGLALLRGLRSLPAYRHTPYLILSTEIAPEKRAQAQAAGVTGWLTKPFQPGQLIATLRRVVG